MQKSTNKYDCESCKGTGMKDAKRNANGSYYRCWMCLGNGLDPAKFFRWSTPKELGVMCMNGDAHTGKTYAEAH